MANAKTHKGSCHCGKVRFEVTSELDQASECNCSICSRVGWLMKSVEPAQFRLLSGEHDQADYQFGAKNMHHLFCKTCGIHAYGTYAAGGAQKVIVNLRCLEGVDVGALEVQKFDGASY